jgi:hypothetical protein
MLLLHGFNLLVGECLLHLSAEVISLRKRKSGDL